MKDKKVNKDYKLARWINWIFLLLSLLILIYNFIQAEIINEGQLFNFYLEYYLFSISFVIFWVLMLRIDKEIHANIITFFMTIIVCLYLFEGVLILIEHSKPPLKENAVIAKEQGVDFDERTKLELIEDLSAEGVNALPAVQSNFFVDTLRNNEESFSPIATLGGVSNRITVYGNESGEYLVYESDRYGFNNPDSQWDSQPIEWMLIGDSFIHGASVQPGEEISALIRSFTGDDVISLGISGNGPLQEYASIIEYAEPVKPKKVLWFYYEGNDIESLVNIQNDSFLMNYMKDRFSQDLINRQEQIDNLLEEYIFFNFKKKMKEKVKDKADKKFVSWINISKYIRLVRLRELMGLHTRKKMRKNKYLFSKILGKAKDRVESWQGDFYFVYLPEYNRYSNSLTFHNQFRYKSSVIDEVKELNIPVIDIHQKVFAIHPDPLALFPFRQSGHYNAEGYREVTKAVLTAIKGMN